MERLEAILTDMREQELPKTRGEFESRAMLYHILIDIEDFLRCKADFVNQLDVRQLKLYWWNRDKDAAASEKVKTSIR